MEKRSPTRTVKVGSFRVPSPKSSAGDPRSALAKRYRQHLKGLEVVRSAEADPDVEVRRGPLASSTRSPGSMRGPLLGGDLDDDDDLE